MRRDFVRVLLFGDFKFDFVKSKMSECLFGCAVANLFFQNRICPSIFANRVKANIFQLLLFTRDDNCFISFAGNQNWSSSFSFENFLIQKRSRIAFFLMPVPCFFTKNFIFLRYTPDRYFCQIFLYGH